MPITLNDTTITGVAAGGIDGVPFASGTALLFHQTTAPTGWTKSTAHDNKALRVVSGTVGSGGSVAFTTAFASKAVSGTVNNHTLTITQMPSHSHGYFPFVGSSAIGGAGLLALDGGGGYRANEVGLTGNNGAHNHSFTGTAINLAVQYVDIIIATKD